MPCRHRVCYRWLFGSLQRPGNKGPQYTWQSRRFVWRMHIRTLVTIAWAYFISVVHFTGPGSCWAAALHMWVIAWTCRVQEKTWQKVCGGTLAELDLHWQNFTFPPSISQTLPSPFPYTMLHMKSACGTVIQNCMGVGHKHKFSRKGDRDWIS